MPQVINLKPYFTFSVEYEATVNCSKKEAYQALFDLQPWPEVLPHVTRIDVKYDDGTFQEFLMDVKGENGDLIQVRSVRKCLEDTIDFFQPTPPEFLKHHCGRWKFEKVSELKTKITASHYWDLNDKSSQKFPFKDNETTEDRISQLLFNHSKLALTTWKNHLENGVRK